MKSMPHMTQVGETKYEDPPRMTQSGGGNWMFMLWTAILVILTLVFTLTWVLFKHL